MKLIIDGRPIGRGVSQMLIRESIGFFENNVLAEHRDVFNKTSLKVNFIHNLQKDYGGCGFTGYVDSHVNPKHFITEIDDAMGLKATLITVAHEFTHLKQLTTGEMQQSLDGKFFRWNGMIIDTKQTHYYDLPWEIEAHGREYGMYDRFINRNNIEIAPAKIIDEDNLLTVISNSG